MIIHDQSRILSTAHFVEKYLACPKCQGQFIVTGTKLECPSCGFIGSVENDVIATSAIDHQSFFDETFQVMEQGNKTDPVWQFCYEQQVAAIGRYIKKDAVILDIGCGPSVPYAGTKQADWLVIGLDPSYKSIQKNSDVDVRIFGSSTEIPLKNKSVDVIFCFYSIHHMVGNAVAENRKMLEKSFSEFGRVISDGGTVLIFDMSPWWPAWNSQKAIWDFAKKRLGRKLDMFFWHKELVESLGNEYFPSAQFEKVKFVTDPFIVFPPIFNAPWLKLPRFAYPFTPYLYAWKF